MHSHIKATLAGAVSAVAMFSFGSAAIAAGHLTPQEQALIPGAKAEGSVTIIHPLFSDRTSQLMGEAFKKRYGLGDDFQFNSLRKGTGATVAQVRQEIQAGKFTVDLILVSAPSFFAEAAERGAFAELDSGYWKDSIELNKAAGQYSEYPYVVTPLAYTFQPVWNASCPGMENFNVTSYADAVAAELKGKTISSDITKSFTYTNTTLALAESGAVNFNEFWPALKATDPLVEFRTEPKMQMVISCQRPFDMWNLSGRVYQNVLKSEDLKDKLKIGSYSEGQVMLGNQVAVLKGAPNPNAGKLLIEFLLSEEGSDIFVEGEAVYSMRAGYKPPAAAAPYLLDLSNTKLLGMKDWVVQAAKDAKPARELWQENFR
jgi:iron(III) transport system substrate-binding protein